MAMFQRTLYLLLSLAAVVLAHGSSFEDDIDSLGVFEEFLPFQLDAREGQTNKNFLRRSLQNQAAKGFACSPADDPRLTWLCMQGMNCGASTQTCDSLPDYSCNCNTGGNSFQSTCSYCRVEMSTGIVCQKTGSRMTFTDPSNKLMTCSCEDTGDGVVRQVCNAPSPLPTPRPTIPPVASAVTFPTMPPVIIPSTAGTTVQNPPLTTPPVVTQTGTTQIGSAQTGSNQNAATPIVGTQTGVTHIVGTATSGLPTRITVPPSPTQSQSTGGIFAQSSTQNARPPTMRPVALPAQSQTNARPGTSPSQTSTGQKPTRANKSSKSVNKARTFETAFRELP